MNCQELATASVEQLGTKVFILNNQYLGMVMQVGGMARPGAWRLAPACKGAGQTAAAPAAACVAA